MNPENVENRPRQPCPPSRQAARGARGTTQTGPAPDSADRRDWGLLALGALLPLLATALLYALDIPLGKPRQFAYPYSPICLRRLAAVPSVIALAGVLAAATSLFFSPRRPVRALGGLVAVLAACGAGVWVYVAPPQFRSQHTFNMLSPSHDGAFLTEGRYLLRTGVREYLRHFPQRAQSPPQAMRGTRVISNPPGTTLLAAGTLRLLALSPGLACWIAGWGLEPDVPAEGRQVIIDSLAFSVALWLLWVLAGPLLYLANRQLLAPAAAAVVALLCWLSPATMLLTPGKDTAQLLTTALPLCLWLLAARRGRAGAAFLAGAAFVLACLLSLVHIWIAAIVLCATTIAAGPEGRRRLAVRCVIPAAGGAAVATAALYALLDANLPAIAWSAARAQAEVTRGAGAMPLAWQALGIPLFLLFAGPALWCCGLWLARGRLRDADARCGAGLVLGSLLVMVATVGFTNVETPRLWIPFTPLLLAGLALQLPLFRSPGRKAATLLTMLVFVQLGAAAVQWSLMDMREAETRLLERAGGARLFH